MADVNTQIVLPRSLATKAKAATPGSGTKSGEKIPRPNENLAFPTVRQLRDSGRKTAAIRLLARDDGIVSAAVFALVQAANSGYTFKAYASGGHEFDPQATELVRSIAASMNTLTDYSKGYSDRNTLDTVVESCLREIVLTGAAAIELVLDKVRLPSKINVLAYEGLEWKKSSEGKFPVQASATGDIELNIPTVWIAESHKDADKAYASSMMEGSLVTSFMYQEYLEDMRRALRRAGHSRILVTLDAEKVRASAPPEIQADPVNLRAFMTQTRDDIASVINALEPEDALISFDLAAFDSVSADGEKQDYKDLLNAISGLVATSLKSSPSILGMRLAGSQSLSNTESLIYLRIARAIQRPVEQVLSRAMTLAVRLYGSDSYVKCEFGDIDLRPASELEAFKIMAQSRILEQLSLGFISDEECAEELGTGPREPGAPELSGTFFHDSSVQKATAETVPLGQDPMGAAMQSDAPKKSGGKDQ
jgi:hypothetical protein